MSDGDSNSDYYSVSDNGSMSDGDMSVSSSPVFGPQMLGTELENSLGKEIRIRINLDGCKGLPPIESLWNSKYRRRSWCLSLKYISRRKDNLYTFSSDAYEGKGIHRGTVQWNETLYIGCFERSSILIELWDQHFTSWGIASVAFEDLLTRSQITLWPISKWPGDVDCTLFLSASRILDDCDEKTCRLDPAEDIPSDDLHIDPDLASSLWNTVLCQFTPFTATLRLVLSEINIRMNDFYWVQMWTFRTLQNCWTAKSHHPHLDQLLTTMAKTMNVVRQSSGALVQHGSDVVQDMLRQLVWLAIHMRDLSEGGGGGYPEYREAELARLVIIIGTPAPITGARSTSAGANRQTIFSAIAKDALICALDALAQSSDACSPLKSVAGGLMFVATWADLVSSNKDDIREICERIGSLVGYFKLAITDGGPLTPALDNTIKALSRDITKLNNAVEEIVTERKSRLRRYVSAKQHRKKLEGVARKLDEARGNYTAAVVTLNATSIADVRAHVQAYTVLVGTTPIYAQGTRRADAGTFSFSPARIEEA